MFDPSATVATVASICKSYGMQYTITRDGAVIGKVYGITGSAAKSDSVDSGVSNLTMEEKAIYVPAGKKPPMPGDELFANKITWTITSVDEYNPGATPVAYKITVS